MIKIKKTIKKHKKTIKISKIYKKTLKNLKFI